MIYVDYIYKKFTDGIARWNEDLRSDVYALFFFIQEGLRGSDANGDRVDFDGVVTLAYSTESQLRQKLARPNPSASRWWGNYQTGEPPIQVPEVTWQTDPIPQEFALRDAWLSSCGASIDSPDYRKHIKSACQNVIEKMHESGFVEEAFGKPIPIFITDSEGIIAYEESIAVNPQAAIAEFVQTPIPEWQKG